MAKQQTEHGVKTYTISTKDNSTSMTFLPERGGFGSSLIMPTKQGPREMLYQHDFFWDKEWDDFPGGWPFLFPVCARIGRDGEQGVYLYNGQRYNLKIHGFGWLKPWDVLDDADDMITMRLRYDEETLAIYPFKFEVILRYQVEDGRLMCHQTYTNHGDKPMPFYAGFHPYFLTPAPGEGKDDVMLDYKPVRRFKYNEPMTDLVGDQPLFDLPSSITNPDILEQLTLVDKDKLVKLHYPDGMSIHMEAQGHEDSNLFPYVQLYTMAEKPFFCAEPWMGFPNAINTVEGSHWLKPGESKSGLMRLWISEK